MPGFFKGESSRNNDKPEDPLEGKDKKNKGKGVERQIAEERKMGGSIIKRIFKPEAYQQDLNRKANESMQAFLKSVNEREHKKIRKRCRRERRSMKLRLSMWRSRII